MPTSSRRALVIGGSLGGLLAAHLLRGKGWDVTVFERNADDLTGRGAGIATHPQLLDILARIGIDFDESMGVKIAISTDAHSTDSLDWMRFGIDQARRGWLEPEDVINTRPLAALRKLLKR